MIGGGLAAGSLAMFGAAAADGYTALLAWMALAGMLSSAAVAASGRAVFGWFPRDERGLALGLRQTAVPAGAALASFTLPPLASAAGVDAALYALAGLMSWPPSPPGVWLRDGPRIESAAPPAPDAARDPRIWRLSAASSLMIIGQIGVTSLLVLYLYSERDWTAAHAALALGAVQVGAAHRARVRGPLVRSARRAHRAVPPAGRRGRRAAAWGGAWRARGRAAAHGGRHRGHELERAVVHRGRGDLGQAAGRQGDGNPEHGDARGGGRACPWAWARSRSPCRGTLVFAVMGITPLIARALLGPLVEDERRRRREREARLESRRPCWRDNFCGPRRTLRRPRWPASCGRAASRTTTSCGAGRSRTSTASGARSGTGSRSTLPYESVLGSREMPGAEWFPGAELNYAEQLFRGARPGETAIVHASESQPLAELSWDELADQVARCAAGLRRLGVERGDRVAAYMPNVPETVVAFLACASIGAVWSSCAPEFGTPTVVDRFKQIEPKVLLATEGYRYGGQGLRPPRAGGGDRGRDPVDRAHRAGPERLGRAALGAGRAQLRAAAVRPPALGSLLVGHDRAPQGDRPGAGRHPAGAPEEVAAAQRPRPRRPLLLVHHDRLDDVELPGRRAAVGRGHRALRRPARSRTSVAVRGRGGGHVVRDERRLHRRLDEGRR